MSAWHNEPVVAEGASALLAINGMFPIVKHVAMLLLVKARYLHLFGRGDEASSTSPRASAPCWTLRFR